MASIYDFTVKDIHGKDVKLDKYKGKALLIVNTASKCGFTPQYKGLEALYEKLKGKGLEILGFPCNQFGAQEPGTANGDRIVLRDQLRRDVPAVRQDRRQRPARGAALPAPQGGEARTARVRNDQVELHQVPRRSAKATSSSVMRRTRSPRASRPTSPSCSRNDRCRAGGRHGARPAAHGAGDVRDAGACRRSGQGAARGVPVGGDGIRSAGGQRPLLELRQSRDLRPAVHVRLSRAALPDRPEHGRGAAADLRRRPQLDDQDQARHPFRRRSGVQGRSRASSPRPTTCTRGNGSSIRKSARRTCSSSTASSSAPMRWWPRRRRPASSTTTRRSRGCGDRQVHDRDPAGRAVLRSARRT